MWLSDDNKEKNQRGEREVKATGQRMCVCVCLCVCGESAEI